MKLGLGRELGSLQDENEPPSRSSIHDLGEKGEQEGPAQCTPPISLPQLFSSVIFFGEYSPSEVVRASNLETRTTSNKFLPRTTTTASRPTASKLPITGCSPLERAWNNLSGKFSVFDPPPLQPRTTSSKWEVVRARTSNNL